MFTSTTQAWDAAVSRNTAALKAIVAQLFALLAVYGGVDAVKVPRAVRGCILRVLRPAESALRRLIVIAARDVRWEPPALRPISLRVIAKKGARKSRGTRLAFQLFDPRKRFGQHRIQYTRLNPRVSFIAADPPFSPLFQKPEPPPKPEPLPENLDGAKRLCRRLKALSAALEDMPRQARRLARIRVQREQRKSLVSPLRPGRPPGYRKIPANPIDLILAEAHDFAHAVLHAQSEPLVVGPNTS